MPAQVVLSYHDHIINLAENGPLIVPATQVLLQISGAQGIPGPVGLPGIIHVQTFDSGGRCGDNGGPPTLVQGWNQDYDFTLAQDSKVFITGHVTQSGR